MIDEPIHRAQSADGTDIAGRVHGQGPPVVLVHGGLGDGETGWRSMLPLLTDQFTCYSMSTRARGLSAMPANGDYRLDRLVEDVVAFVDTIGQPVGLVGYSLGGTAAFGAAAASDAVTALAVYEPAVFDVATDVDPRSGEIAGRFTDAVSAGRHAEAARILIGGVTTGNEMERLAEEGAFDAWAPNIPVSVEGVQQVRASTGPTPTDPAVLARIHAPVLYLHSNRTPTTWYADGGRFVASHLADCRVVEIDGVGHLAPILDPGPIAAELASFFATALDRVGRP